MLGNRKIGVGYKITFLVFLVVLISVFSVGYIAFYLSRTAIEQRYQESLEVVARLKTQKIEAFFEKIRDNLEFGSQLQVVQQRCQTAAPALPDTLRRDSITPAQRPTIRPVNQNDRPIAETKDSTHKITAPPTDQMSDVFAGILESYDIRNVYLTDLNGRVIFNQGETYSPTKNGTYFGERDPNTISVGRDSVYFSNVFPINNDYMMYVSAPVRKGDKRAIGVIVYEVRLKYIFDLVRDTTGLGNTGEIIIAKNFGNQINYLNNPRLNRENTKPRGVYLNSTRETALQKATREELGEGLGDDIDYRGNRVQARWNYIPLVDWGLVVKFDKTEIYEPVYTLRNTLFLTGVVVFMISLFIGIIFSRSILVRPLLLLEEIINLLSKGVLPDKMTQGIQSNDEIGEMNEKLNELVENLQEKAEFARTIGQGNLQAALEPASEQDTLGLALLAMRNNIQQAEERDDERSWIVTGLAEIGDILPSIQGIDELGELVSEFITKKIGAVQGAFYVVNDTDKANVFLDMTASYAYNKQKNLKARFKFAEGLVGQAAIEQDTIIRTEIPDNYLTISSGILGDRKPKCLLITPLITNETVYGVLEFAGFERFGHREIEFVKEVSELIARTIFNIRVRENTEVLLEESQKLTAELQVQQEVLRQNAEIMEATQEELQRTNRELQNQIQEVQRANDRTRLLLENASEVITIYEPNGTIRYISPSVTKILGYTQDEMIGIRDVVYVHPMGVESFEEMFRDLLHEPEEKVTIQFSYLTKSGDRIWLEATGTNLLSDPAIQGIVVNSRDITERRAAEKEQRLRGQMQALSENSPDLITRITKEGRVFYINPIIETYTGLEKEQFLQKNLTEIELSEAILATWRDIVRDVMTRNQKVSLDMDFPSVMGDRVMQVNAIPEYNDQENLESVLVVSHDITERKIIELEISQKNRKITESINYAKRIQEAILPDTSIIRQYLPDSFILYKPRDVVSGDFPWFLQTETDTFIAAVDCTGHGVPGALISLIGYFLLNNIVNVREVTTPGEMLDLLDEEVTKTLRQDEGDAATRDGMDIALCKINRHHHQIEYAGAHRPLYYVEKGELYEIRGNKFPIGGAQYKNRARFTNTIINYEQGDSVYLFSDGFPDQFGGAKNKKFSPRKIREIIQENQPLPLSELNVVLDEEFEKWRGSNKQTDDVLMIGIKL